MKKVLSIVLLISALNIQAMEQKGKQSPQQQKKRETSEELLRKAAEALAIEQREEQEKLAAEQKAAEQKDELTEAWNKLLGDVENIYSVLGKKGKASFATLRKEIDTRATKIQKEQDEPCIVTDGVKELCTQWLKFSTWVDKKQDVEQEEVAEIPSQPAVEPVEQKKSVVSEEEMNELLTGLSLERTEFFKSMINEQGFTRDQLDSVKGLIKELRENQIQ